MNIIKTTGKFLDQPILVAKFKNKVPFILSSGATIYGVHEVKKQPQENRKKTAIKTFTTLTATVLTALLAPKISNKAFNVNTKNLAQIKEESKILIETFLKNNKTDSKTEQILNKAKNKILSFKEIQHLLKKYERNEQGNELINKLIPNPENITSKEIFSEIGRLSLLGIIPVIGGISGGILGDIFTEDKWKSFIPNKIKEGTYQYLANIFLCNVGAGVALALMEKKHIQSKSQRALGMVGGIITTGVVGGSAIANIIANKLINPAFGNKSQNKIYNERKPEALDIGLHTDDIATVAVMSGLKWIEPALPIMYAISGYRAGIGYRNNPQSKI